MSDAIKKESATVENGVQEMDAGKMNGFVRLVNIIFSPYKTMEAIRERPTVLAAMIFLPILPVLYYVLFWDAYEVQVIEMLEMSFRSQGLEPTREIMSTTLKVVRISTPITTAVTLIIMSLLSAVIYFAISRLMKKEVRYKQVLSMVLHVSIIANLIWLLHMLFTLVLGESIITEPMTGAVSLLPSEMFGSVLYGLLAPIEIMSLWSMAVLFIGLRVVCGHSKKAAGIIVAVGLLLSMLLSTGGMMMSGLGGM